MLLQNIILRDIITVANPLLLISGDIITITSLLISRIKANNG